MHAGHLFPLFFFFFDLHIEWNVTNERSESSETESSESLIKHGCGPD